MLPLDNYYRDRGDKPPETINYDHPDAFEFSLLHEHLKSLKRGHAINMPQYDFVTHHRQADTEPLEPRSVMIVEGILTLIDAQLNNQYDLKIFLDSESNARRQRRLQRDTQERGRSVASIEQQLAEQVEPMYAAYVGPSADAADWVIQSPSEFNDYDAVVTRVVQWVGAQQVKGQP